MSGETARLAKETVVVRSVHRYKRYTGPALEKTTPPEVTFHRTRRRIESRRRSRTFCVAMIRKYCEIESFL
jgi:hypothetical protein